MDEVDREGHHGTAVGRALSATRPDVWHPERSLEAKRSEANGHIQTTGRIPAKRSRETGLIRTTGPMRVGRLSALRHAAGRFDDRKISA